jgi:uncharacterized DUF497 family protein
VPDFLTILWDDEPGGNVEHLAEHGVTPEEAEQVIRARFGNREPSRSNSDRWICYGFTSTDRFLFVVFDYLEDLDILLPITAFEREDI